MIDEKLRKHRRTQISVLTFSIFWWKIQKKSFQQFVFGTITFPGWSLMFWSKSGALCGVTVPCVMPFVVWWWPVWCGGTLCVCVVPCVVSSTLNVWCPVWCGDGASPGEAGTQDDGEGTVGIISCHNACQLFLSHPGPLVQSIPGHVPNDLQDFLNVTLMCDDTGMLCDPKW